MCIDVKAISEMLDWGRFQDITRIVYLTDSMSTLAKIQTGMIHDTFGLVASIGRSNLQCIRWILCPRHAGVNENDRADDLAGEATNESGSDPPEICHLTVKKLPKKKMEIFGNFYFYF